MPPDWRMRASSPGERRHNQLRLSAPEHAMTPVACRTLYRHPGRRYTPTRQPRVLTRFGGHDRHRACTAGANLGPIEKPLGESGSGDRGQTGLTANFRQTAPEIHVSLVSPRMGTLSDHQFFMRFRRPKAHPNRQPIPGKLRRKSVSVPGLRRISGQQSATGPYRVPK